MVNLNGNTIHLQNAKLQIQAIVAPSASSNGALHKDEAHWQHWDGSQPLPPDAVQAGRDTNGVLIYVGQVSHEGNLLPAKVFPNARCALFAYDGEELRTISCQLLCCRNVSWVDALDGSIPNNAIPGGRTASGEVLYIGRTSFCGSVTPGKVVPSERKLYIPYGSCEVATKHYELLVLK
uniref:DUF3421 domain-containing protein n=1 Tax=Anopheles atroparvus TaxID=41427 RepID=A0AAG5D5F1_ANOAO